MSEEEKNLEFAMSLITYSGDAKSSAMEAIFAAKKVHLMKRKRN